MLGAPGVICSSRRRRSSPKSLRSWNRSGGGENIALPCEDVTELARLLEQDALVVPGQADVRGAIAEDPTDEMFLACALDAAADFIVTGDHHLLDLKSYRGIPIVTVQQFADQLTRPTAL